MRGGSSQTRGNSSVPGLPLLLAWRGAGVGQWTSGTLASHEPRQAVGQHEKAMAAVGVRSPDLHAFTPGAHVLP